MRRQACILAVVAAIIASHAEHGSGQPLSSTPSSQAALARAERLNGRVVKLYGDGKVREAIPLAEESLSLREKALGPIHLDVATSLNNLALLYEEQGMFDKAMMLYVRALDIREKALGAMHPEVAQSLSNLALLHQALAQYDRAEPLLIRALDIREKAFGPAHADVAASLNNLAFLYQVLMRYAQAESLLIRSLDIFEKERGLVHPDVATSLNNLALLYDEQGLYGKAEPLYVRALDIREKALGSMHPQVAQSLNNLGVLYQMQGAYEEAESLLARALVIRERTLGPRHLDVAVSLGNLALLYKAQGELRKAEPLLIRSLDIREKLLGPMHPDVATSLDSLAVLYKVQGGFGEAEPFLVRALDIREKALGPKHSDVATSLSNLALLYQARGLLDKAEPLLVRALEIKEESLGARHPDVARSLNNLAMAYRAQGALGKAAPLLIRALDIREKALGAKHPDVARSLNNLALFYQEQGDFSRAELLHVRALDIREKALGPRHPDVAESLNNLARLHESQDALGKAEPLYVRALDILEKTFGPMHPYVAANLNNLAGLYLAQGFYDRAEALYIRALDISEKSLGRMHSAVATTLNNLASLYLARRLGDEAEPLLSRAADIRETQLRLELARLSEPRKRALMELSRGETEARVSFHVHDLPGSGRALELALTAVLRNKGRALDSLIENRAVLRDHLTPRLREQLHQLERARAELTARLYGAVDPASGMGQGGAVSALRAQIDDLESGLSAASAEIRAQTEPVMMADVQAALPPGTALMEIVRYQRFDLQKIQQPWQEERYIAYVLTSSGPSQWVALGEAAAIDAGVDAVLATMHKDPDAAATKAALQHLHALVLAPVSSRLTGVSHLVVAPDGKLNLVPFEALMDPQGSYLLKQYVVSYVTTGRDLLRLAHRRSPQSRAMIVAVPDYGPGKRFRDLPGAAAEVREIGNYFLHGKTLTGGAATKQALSSVVGPALLHVATHGFYARGGEHGSGAAVAASKSRSTEAPKAESFRKQQRGMAIEAFEPTSALFPSALVEDPLEALDRAGLALAGANAGADGIMTAREIAGMNWWGTQLVVLSACETGVGAVPSGEGVYGMRRALVLSGAEAQVVSLWSVSDSSARELMKAFYGELSRGVGRAEALRRAKLALLQQPQFAHPYYWAAFIQAGDWRPLRKGALRRTAAEK